MPVTCWSAHSASSIAVVRPQERGRQGAAADRQPVAAVMAAAAAVMAAAAVVMAAAAVVMVARETAAWLATIGP
jgi:hypothetical protein